MKNPNTTGTISDRTESCDEQCYKLPNEARGVEQLELLTDKLLLGYISEGAFYLVDLGQSADNDSRLQIALEIRIPGAHIGQFSVDRQMNTLTLATTNGNTFLYNLPLALKNEQQLANKKIRMGVEKDLVHNYLQKVNAVNFAEETMLSAGPSIGGQSFGGSVGLQSQSIAAGIDRPIQISIED